MREAYYAQEMGVEKLEKTDQSTSEGEKEVFTAVLRKDKDGIKTTVTIKVEQPKNKGASKRTPLDGLLIAQKHDVMVGSNQTTLEMPGAKKK